MIMLDIFNAKIITRKHTTLFATNFVRNSFYITANNRFILSPSAFKNWIMPWIFYSFFPRLIHSNISTHRHNDRIQWKEIRYFKS